MVCRIDIQQNGTRTSGGAQMAHEQQVKSLQIADQLGMLAWAFARSLGIETALLTNSIWLYGHGHEFELDASCEEEKMIWLGVFQETVIEAPAWPFEALPPSSLASLTEGHAFEGENVVTVQYVEEPLLYEAMTALSMNQSIAELEITSWSHHLYELPSF
ncbi:hypothetical protein EW146_g5351 [Bondarzewia mesenterica]|uniref:Uncharacterized protein n=1 Tax=Bondarzewia mesenterica TaxID=1095465 RepID=A0A4S4LRT7_9AGAM|nr:hypothetical protein EW146_g5351 [Bondarzewia mesenterica]